VANDGYGREREKGCRAYHHHSFQGIYHVHILTLILVSYFYIYYYNHDLVSQKSIKSCQVLSDKQYCRLARYHTLSRPDFCWYVPPPCLRSILTTSTKVPGAEEEPCRKTFNRITTYDPRSQRTRHIQRNS
jgi:hypothetical protein